MAKKITSAPAANLSEGIRTALIKLGIDAAAKDVASEVSKNSELAKRVKAIGDDWDNYVSGQRRKLRGGTVSKKPLPKYSTGMDVTIGNILDLGRIKSMLKDPANLGEIIELIDGLGPSQKMKIILAKYAELMLKYGDEKKAVEFLAAIQEMGLKS